MDTISNPGFLSAVVPATPTSAFVTPIVDLRLDKQGSDDVGLTWTLVTTAQGVDVHRIYEGAEADGLTFTGATTPATVFTRAGDLSDGQVHFYSVTVVDGTGAESPE